jgi:TrmH family RNA methyltransferase
MEILGQKDNLPPPQSTPHLTRFVLPSNLFKALDVMGTHSPLLICRISDFPLFDLTTPPQGLEVLCPFGDPRNVGSIMRSCLAFGVAKLILLKEAAHPFHPNAIRSSSGAVFDQKIYRGPALPELNQEDVLRWIVALDLQGEDLTTWHWPSNVRLLIGEEGLGQPALHFRKKVTIRHSKDIHSLNATVAGTIALFSYRRLFPIRCP